MMRAILAAVMILGWGCTGAVDASKERHGDDLQPAHKLIAAFKEDGSLKKKYPDAQLVEHYGEVTLWKLEHSQPVWRELQATGRYSPVFGEKAGQLRALPGGVVLQVEPGARGQDLLAQLRSSGNQVTPAAGLPDIYLVASAPGLAALELAEQLSARPGVKSAEPNWWHAYVSRRR